MILKLKFLILTGVVAAVDCFNSVKVISRRNIPENGETSVGVFHGNKTSIQNHPYLVSILLQGAFHCAGTIINQKWILTTAGCVYMEDPETMEVVSGSSDSITGRRYQVEKVIQHPKYKVAISDYEYACIKIKGTFRWSRKSRPINLPKRAPKANTLMTVAGWGVYSMSKKGESNAVMLEGKMYWLSKKDCKSIFTKLGYNWTDTMACAYNKGKTTLCPGDWADAFVYRGVIYGMFILGIPKDFCTVNAMPVLVADIQKATSWIKHTTRVTRGEKQFYY